MSEENPLSNLRNILATLYPVEATARRLATDAGLDERQIDFGGSAINIWHAIMGEAVKANKVAALLQIVLAEYGANPALQAAYHSWRDQQPATDQRAQEVAYLDHLRQEYHYWAEKYTPLAGIAEVRAATTAGPRLDLPLLFMPTGFEQLIEHGFGEARRTERVAVNNLLDAVARYRRLVLLGEPGSGKTTTLWRLVHDYAQAAKKEATAPLPLLVALGGYTGPEPLLDYCQKALALPLLPCLRQGRLILLLDGLNEMPRRDYAERVARVQQLLADYPDLPVVVTCRALDYVETLALEKLEVKALDPIRQLAYLQRYLGQDEGEKLFWQLVGSHEVAELWQTWQAAGGDWTAFWTAEKMPDTVYQKTSGAQDELWARLRQADLPPLLALGRNPYMLVMLAQVYAAHQRLPQNRGRLFAAFVATLLTREEKRCDPAYWPGAEVLRQALAQLAYAMQQAGERGTALDESWATAQITVAGQRAADLLYLATSATLLEWRDGTVRFVHQLVQEYFAAVALYNAWQAGADLTIYWPQGWQTPSGWEETFVLLAGVMPTMTDLIEALLPVNPPLAARCIATSGGPPPPAATQTQVQQTLVKLATGRRAPLAQRTAAGVALNHLGDPRPGVGLTSAGLPDLVWCPVAAGEFLLGNTKATDDMARDNESPQHRLHLPAFAISQYPITNIQYAAFVADGGYRALWQHCWSADGWQWRVENNLDGPQRYGDPYNLPNHPVVGVSWYEAMAFCAWLSHKLGRLVRLPSEAEWEKAARSLDGRRYPWGEQLTREHANYSETGIDSTSAVGIFPKGVSPYGALEMAGNVWEWTGSLWDQDREKANFGYPYDPQDGREDPAAAGRRVVRGGSFVNFQLHVRCAFRDRFVTVSRHFRVGFRVVAPGS